MLLALQESSDAGAVGSASRGGLTWRGSSVRRLSFESILMIWLQACSALTSSQCRRGSLFIHTYWYTFGDKCHTPKPVPASAPASDPTHAYRTSVTCPKSVEFYIRICRIVSTKTDAVVMVLVIGFVLGFFWKNNSNRSAIQLRLFEQNQLKGQRQKQKEGKSFFSSMKQWGTEAFVPLNRASELWSSFWGRSILGSKTPSLKKLFPRPSCWLQLLISACDIYHLHSSSSLTHSSPPPHVPSMLQSFFSFLPLCRTELSYRTMNRSISKSQHFLSGLWPFFITHYLHQ